MGLNDTQEMLDAALADAVVYERHIATLTEQVARMAHRIAKVRALADDPDAIIERDGERGIYLDRLIPILDADE